MVELAFLLTLLAVAAGMVAAGAYVARAKGRSPVEGALLSFVLGPIGVLVEVLLPTIDADEGRACSRSDSDDDAMDDAAREFLGASTPARPKEEDILARVARGLGPDADDQAEAEQLRRDEAEAIARVVANTRGGSRAVRKPGP